MSAKFAGAIMCGTNMGMSITTQNFMCIIISAGSDNFSCPKFMTFGASCFENFYYYSYGKNAYKEYDK